MIPEDEEYLIDALVSEPMPYRTAIRHGATHVIVLRTRPDPSPILQRSGLYENVIARRFLTRFGLEGNSAASYVARLDHQKIYAEDILLLNKGVEGPPGGVDCTEVFDCTGKSARQGVHILPVAPGEESKEISQLEIRQDVILRGMRDGARRVLNIFLPLLMSDGDDSLDLNGAEFMHLRHLSTEDVANVILNCIFPAAITEDFKARNKNFFCASTGGDDCAPMKVIQKGNMY